MNFWTRFLCDEDAPTFVEYGLLVSLIAFTLVIVVGLFGVQVADLFDAGYKAFL